MELEEILRLDRCPFDYGAMGGEPGRDAEETFMEEKARFALFLRYMERFARQCGLQVPVPAWNCYMEKGGSKMLFMQNKEKIMEELFQNAMAFCGWGVGSVRLENGGHLSELFPEGIVSLQEWEDIFSSMQGFGTLGEQGFRDITAIICWNQELYDYHDFSQRNEALIKRRFSGAEKVIAQILRKTADPFSLGTERAMSRFKDGKYIMGFFEADHSGVTVSMLDMDYNFMVQILILHMLTGCAEKQFGYRQEGKKAWL